jgi:hypothetical protein
MAITRFTSTVATPGTPQRLIAGATPALATMSGAYSGTIAPWGSRIVVVADSGNTAGKSVIVGDSTLNVGTGAGIIAKIAPGAEEIIYQTSGAAKQDVGVFFVDTDGTVAKYVVRVEE